MNMKIGRQFQEPLFAEYFEDCTLPWSGK